MTTTPQMAMRKIEKISLLIKRKKMSCIWNLFRKKQSIIPNQPDLRISNPLNLNELPDDEVTLKALESVIIDKLIALHYKLEQAKEGVKYNLQKGLTDRVKESLAKRAVLTERKRILEARLQRVQAHLQEIKVSK